MAEILEPSERHASWDHIDELLATGAPAVQVIRGSPPCEVHIGGAGQNITMRIPVSDQIDPAPLREQHLRLRTTKDGDQKYLELSTSNSDLFEDFYTFVCLVTDKVQQNGMDPLQAILETLGAWSALLQTRERLSPEAEYGLWGELWFLQYLANQFGWPAAIACWKGAESEEHDFGLPTVDIEVKTTVGESRRHMISSLTQMVPSPGRPLFVLSIQITAGTSVQEGADRLPTLVDGVRAAAGPAGAETTERLETLLDQLKWRDDNHDLYKRHFRLRSEPALVPVDERFPAIVPPLLSGLGNLVGRILQVTYRVDLTDLGTELRGTDGMRLLGFQ